MNEKLWAAISLIANLIFGILLLVWKDDNSKIAITNALDKIINTIIQTFVLLKGKFCFEEKINVKDKEEMKRIGQKDIAKNLLNEMENKSKPIGELNEFVEKNKNTQNEEIKKEVEDIEKLLEYIKSQAENIMKEIKVINE